MLNDRDKGNLITLIKFCDRLENLLSSISKDNYNDSLDYKEITCFNLLQIGEVSKKLSDAFTNKYNEVPWKQIKGLRDIIVHDYGSIDFDIVWETVKRDITDLNKYCKKILKDNG